LALAEIFGVGLFFMFIINSLVAFTLLFFMILCIFSSLLELHENSPINIVPASDSCYIKTTFSGTIFCYDNNMVRVTTQLVWDDVCSIKGCVTPYFYAVNAVCV